MAYDLPTEEGRLGIRLSSGEEAGVAVRVLYDPRHCRAQCTVPSGCPAVGLGDPQRVSDLARRLKSGDVGSTATLTLDGKEVSTLDLSTHGAVKAALDATPP
ncbi:MAG: hypothetical protein JOZ69_14615 [Myxococcales bacterium]|nr:hypothetical protein [Myxococcales bacterium]